METNAKDLTIDQFRQENKQLNAEVQRLREMETKYGMLQEQCESYAKRCSTMEECLEKKRKDYVLLQAQQNQMEAELTSRVQCITNELEIARTEHVSLKGTMEDRIRSLEIQLDTQKRHAQMAKTQLLDMEDDRKEQSTTVLAASDRIEQLQQVNTQMEAQLNNLLHTTNRQTQVIHECDAMLTQTRQELEGVHGQMQLKVDENTLLLHRLELASESLH